MSLTFFAKKQYFHAGRNHLMRGSSMIRGEQIAEYLGAKLNPTSGYENDICIYVKPACKKDGSPSIKFNERSYVDMIDNVSYIEWLRLYPELSGIVASKYAYDFIKKMRLRNKIVFIPQQHCNFENFRRDRKTITTVGIIGVPRAFEHPIDEVRKKLEEIGLKLLTNFDFQTRDDVVNFYKNIDIQIVWSKRYRLLKNPLKIINAASFCVPTVGYPHKGYREVEGYYIRTSTIDQLIEEVAKLKDQNMYENATKNLLEMASKYDISKIAEMYRQLENIPNEKLK